jgi:hypothetical protein
VVGLYSFLCQRNIPPPRTAVRSKWAGLGGNPHCTPLCTGEHSVGGPVLSKSRRCLAMQRCNSHLARRRMCLLVHRVIIVFKNSVCDGHSTYVRAATWTPPEECEAIFMLWGGCARHQFCGLSSTTSPCQQSCCHCARAPKLQIMSLHLEQMRARSRLFPLSHHTCDGLVEKAGN